MTPRLARLDGYAALLTGAGQGIGAAAARRLASEGAAVLVTDLDADRAARTAAGIREAGATAESLACDVGDRAAVGAAVAHAVDVFGRLDVLVNNAYADHEDAPLFEDETDEMWARSLDITLTGAYRCSRAALPHLVASGRGAIVNIGSVNGEQDFGGHAYSAAKAGLASLTRTLAGHAGPVVSASTSSRPARSARTPGRAARTHWSGPGPSTRSAASANRTTSRPPWPSLPPRTRPGSPARPCVWTAGCSPSTPASARR